MKHIKYIALGILGFIGAVLFIATLPITGLIYCFWGMGQNLSGDGDL